VAAKAGDLGAQYNLFAVIDYCKTILDFYFTKDRTPLTLDEGLEMAPNASIKHYAQEAFPHCHRFREHNVALELGTAEYWLERAAQSGQPLAQAVTAERILDRKFQTALEQLEVERLGDPVPRGTAIAVANFVGPAPDPQAVALLRAAVTSLEPGVLEIIGRAQFHLRPFTRYDTVNEMAWVYIACQRGADCSPTSHWATNCSGNCDISTPDGIVKGWSRDEWPAVQQRAKEINAKLIAGKWDELGLNP
jgi:hypothetical protein